MPLRMEEDGRNSASTLATSSTRSAAERRMSSSFVGSGGSFDCRSSLLLIRSSRPLRRSVVASRVLTSAVPLSLAFSMAVLTLITPPFKSCSRCWPFRSALKAVKESWIGASARRSTKSSPALFSSTELDIFRHLASTSSAKMACSSFSSNRLTGERPSEEA